MKRKNAFTLIELLAVIVVLAIIALIATPIVMNTIKNAKKGAAERTADNYIKQVETAVAEAKLENKSVPNGTYDIDGNGNLTGAGLPDGKLEINMSGNKPTSGKIKITNGSVDQSSSSMAIGDYSVSYNSTKKTYEATEKGSTTQVEVLCTAKTTATTGKIPSGNYAYGDEYTCELGDNDEKTFFVLETNGDNVSLIMNKNIDSNGKGTTSGNTVAWCKSGNDNSCAADGALEYLKTSTTGWTKLTESQISLPSYDQIYKAAGNKDEHLPKWLYGNLNSSSAPYTYWTSTPSASDSLNAWYVYCDGYLYKNNVNLGSYGGVRPVITVSKSNLS